MLYKRKYLLPKDQSDWGKLIVQKALELAMMGAYIESYEDSIPEDELPGVWEKADFMGGQC
jgi:hypothetical protein